MSSIDSRIIIDHQRQMVPSRRLSPSILSDTVPTKNKGLYYAGKQVSHSIIGLGPFDCRISFTSIGKLRGDGGAAELVQENPYSLIVAEGRDEDISYLLEAVAHGVKDKVYKGVKPVISIVDNVGEMYADLSRRRQYVSLQLERAYQHGDTIDLGLTG